ncbi:MAG: RNase III inhibitor, partial [Spirochaetales bacterium]|nr:RNase III inhibitor [Candidatus Physcosoma equi]
IMPRKYTILALAFSLRLERSEAEELLQAAGYALSPSSMGDIILGYAFRDKIYDITAINEILYTYDEELLGQSR